MSEISNALEKRDQSPAAMIASYKTIYAGVLPSHMPAEAFVRLAQGVIRKDRALAQAAMNNPASFMAALLDCARLGHEPGTPAYYLVPLKGAIEGWEGYRGVIERIYRAGAVESVQAAVVREKDFYDYELGMDRPVHRFDRFAGEGERGPLKGVFAYATMVGGGISRVVEMGQAEVYKHRDMNPSAKRPDSPWNKWEDSMWLKCAVHELEKWVPSSSEYRRSAAIGMQVAPPPASRPPVRAAAGDVMDGEVIDHPTSGPPAQRPVSGPPADGDGGGWPEVAQPGSQP